ncbi:MAG: hypothetical protein A3F68_01955 [Acidobacteria bacterium RIFCSPLOWO2_12_FULL_54_10]|nr:MAG: hypothetical protein A3F68_01955 [Acidobacteria bacterium RIFCSPLOWO2_12_FULL_54_10]
MASRPSKFCMDLDRNRWTLLDGVITRKTQNDGPMDGKTLSIDQVFGIEKTFVSRSEKSPLALPVVFFGVIVLLISWLIAMWWWVAAVPGFLIGVICLLWGLKKIFPKTHSVDAYKIIAPNTNPNEWMIVGSISEIMGFVEGVRTELQQKEKQAHQSVQ